MGYLRWCLRCFAAEAISRESQPLGWKTIGNLHSTNTPYVVFKKDFRTPKVMILCVSCEILKEGDLRFPPNTSKQDFFTTTS